LKWWIPVGGVAAIGVFMAKQKSDETRDEIARATGILPPADGVEFAPGNLPTFDARLTGYWPFVAKTTTERIMEGGLNDRKGKPLHTLEMHTRDSAAHPYVSVSGDDAIFPYGQRIIIDAWPDLIFRVVDTGSHFRGINKVYRIFGREPLDICVDSSETTVPKLASVQIVPGDNFANFKPVNVAGFEGQSVPWDNSEYDTEVT
jgi:hypothetical protein